MGNTEAPISITVKTPSNTLVTIRANDGMELDQLVSMSLDAVAAAVDELEKAVRGTGLSVSATPSNPNVAYATQAFNATVVETPPFSAAPSLGGGRTCMHGKMTALQGPAKTGGVYKGYFCPSAQGDPTKCKTQYVNKNEPEWNTFVADRVK